jgi:Sulfotransferase domain
MSLKVIGAGLPRTGTLSMKAALEELEFGRCYHMEEVFAAPWRAKAWASFFTGGPVDWDEVFEGYGAAVDAPACFAWRAIVDHHPDAKVVLTVRDPESWMTSMYRTIFADGYIDSLIASPMGPMFVNMQQVMMSLMGGGPPPGSPPPEGPPPPEALLALREAQNGGVIAGVNPERLLVFDVREGWAPLCRFLGVNEPATPFPKVNEAEGFFEHFAVPTAS